jgi:hypothetical protein
LALDQHEKSDYLDISQVSFVFRWFVGWRGGTMKHLILALMFLVVVDGWGGTKADTSHGRQLTRDEEFRIIVFTSQCRGVFDGFLFVADYNSNFHPGADGVVRDHAESSMVMEDRLRLVARNLGMSLRPFSGLIETFRQEAEIDIKRSIPILMNRITNPELYEEVSGAHKRNLSRCRRVFLETDIWQDSNDLLEAANLGLLRLRKFPPP